MKQLIPRKGLLISARAHEVAGNIYKPAKQTAAKNKVPTGDFETVARFQLPGFTVTEARISVVSRRQCWP